MIAFWNSYIANNYKFKEEVVRRAATAEFARRCEESATDFVSRDEFLVYMRGSYRFTDQEIGINNRRGIGETYDRARKVATGKRHSGKGENDGNETFPMGL